MEGAGEWNEEHSQKGRSGSATTIAPSSGSTLSKPANASGSLNQRGPEDRGTLEDEVDKVNSDAQRSLSIETNSTYKKKSSSGSNIPQLPNSKLEQNVPAKSSESEPINFPASEAPFNEEMLYKVATSASFNEEVIYEEATSGSLMSSANVVKSIHIRKDAFGPEGDKTKPK